MREKEFRRASAAKGGLLVVKGVAGVAFGDHVVVRDHRGRRRNGQVIRGSDEVTLVQVLEGTDDMLERVMDVNVNALFWGAKAFVPGMLERGDGHVVTIASITSIVPTPGMATYTVSKHAAYGFGETLRTELRGTGVRSTVVMPFFVGTGMFAGAGTVSLPFFTQHLEPSDVAHAIVTAVERDSSRVTLPRFGIVAQTLRALPPTIYDAVAERVGLFSVMSDFTGRADAPGAPR